MVKEETEDLQTSICRITSFSKLGSCLSPLRHGLYRLIPVTEWRLCLGFHVYDLIPRTQRPRLRDPIYSVAAFESTRSCEQMKAHYKRNIRRCEYSWWRPPEGADKLSIMCLSCVSIYLFLSGLPPLTTVLSRCIASRITVLFGRTEATQTTQAATEDSS